MTRQIPSTLRDRAAQDRRLSRNCGCRQVRDGAGDVRYTVPCVDHDAHNHGAQPEAGWTA